MQFKIRSKIWIEVGDKVFLGEGRIKLLKSIQETKSLSKGAKAINMSYNKAWKLIQTMNKTTEKLVVVKNTGGKGGGGTKITSYGKELINSFEKINKKSWKFLDKQTSFLTL